nr:hypothetical protein [Lachnospiraceae bacterium]
MKKNLRSITILCIASICLVLSGCGKEGEETGVNGLSEEEIEREEKLVAEYAAGLLLKYDANGYNGLTYATPTPEPTPFVTEPEGDEMGPGEGMGPGADPSISVESVEGMNDISNTEGAADIGIDPETAEPAASSGSISSALGIPDLNVNYTGYEVKDHYPDEQGEGFYFSMDSEE